MGCFISYRSKPIKPIKNEIETFLEEAQAAEKYQFKILLLGAGESGKSTVVKQIKMLYKVGGGPSSREMQEYTLAIRRNIMEAIQILLDASKSLKIPLKNENLQEG